MYCPKCGSQIPENDRFCPTCGDPVLGRSFPDESDHTADFVKEDIERTKILSALCYLYFVFICYKNLVIACHITSIKITHTFV